MTIVKFKLLTNKIIIIIVIIKKIIIIIIILILALNVIHPNKLTVKISTWVLRHE